MFSVQRSNSRYRSVATNPDIIALASAAFQVIDAGKVPSSVLAGNHDIVSSTDDQRGDTPYLWAFGPRRFAAMPTFGGASPDGYNSRAFGKTDTVHLPDRSPTH